MTFEEIEHRRALKNLASQVGASCPGSRNASTAEPEPGGKWMFFIGATLMFCLVWLTYSRWLNPAEERASATATSAMAASRGDEERNVNGAWNAARPTLRSSGDTLEPAGKRVEKSPPPALAPAGLDEHLEERVAAVEAFARRGDSRAIEAVLDALQDDDWRVRSRAINAAVNAYVAIPESTLIDRAQSDPSPDVRFLALAGIAARIDPVISQVPAIDPATARSLSRLALSDSSESVRWQAQQILDTLDQSQAPHDPSQAEVL
jgi:hypothetical protein